jgi:hypothetical protein
MQMVKLMGRRILFRVLDGSPAVVGGSFPFQEREKTFRCPPISSRRRVCKA